LGFHRYTRDLGELVRIHVMTRAPSTAIFVQISSYAIAIHDVTFSRPILMVDISSLAIL
jgi:hypothetical protein